MVTEAISPEFLSKLEARGVSRRSFMKLCGSLAVAAGLSELAAPRVARAIEDSVIGAESGGLYPAILTRALLALLYGVSRTGRCP